MFGGLDQLTPDGMNQQFKLGQFIKSSYASFFNLPYDQKRVFIRSTNYDKALMSAYTLLAGLYPPAENEVWNQQFLNWQPIPVHTNEKNLDMV
jgi:lysosomal acid phosphatase